MVAFPPLAARHACPLFAATCAGLIVALSFMHGVDLQARLASEQRVTQPAGGISLKWGGGGGVTPPPPPAHVAVWIPHSDACDGVFAARTSATAPDGPVALVVREATVDYRHVSVAEFRGKHGLRDYRRVLLLLTNVPQEANGMQTYILKPVHSHRKKEHARAASIVNADGSPVDGGVLRGLSVSFDYLLDDKRCEQNCKRFPRCRVREWKAVVSIVSGEISLWNRLPSVLERLVKDGARLRLYIPVELRSPAKQVEAVTVEVALSCVAGLTSATAMPPMPFMPAREESCESARGSVQISGGPLFGARRKEPRAWRELSHFAARHLYGTTYFDIVAVALLPDFSVAEIASRCAADSFNKTCAVAHHDANREYLRVVRGEMELEFSKIGVPQEDWSRVILFMACRLGTDFEGREAGLPCDVSHHAGQKIVGHIGYAMFAPYHHWASNFDVDEFLYDELASPQPQDSTETRLVSAESRFNGLRNATKRDVFYTLWLDFRVQDEDLIDFTRRVMHGHAFKFTGYEGAALNVSACYGGGGKVAVSCMRSTSFMVHFGFSLRKISDLSSGECDSRHKRSPNEEALYSYHMRQPPRQGECLYDPSVPVDDVCTLNPRDSVKCVSSVSVVG
jgi:hypothetical protein